MYNKKLNIRLVHYDIYIGYASDSFKLLNKSILYDRIDEETM